MRRFLAVGGGENRAAGDESVGACGGASGGDGGCYAAVDLQPRAALARIQKPPRGGDFFDHRRDERLTAEAGIDRHQQNRVEFVERVIQNRKRRGGIERQSGGESGVADRIDGAVDMADGFGMKRNAFCAGGGERGDEIIDGFGHQMDIPKSVGQGARERAQNRRPDGQIGRVVIVHHIQMQPFAAGVASVAGFFAETRKIGGEQTGGDNCGVSHRD